ncbi:DUF7380 domain-containing protein [Woeseia oceani]|uniref:DUF7380 domain-containing protein n=1 Tax=Woeseia oceani TaxID=1548547 RepID=A0A193LC20_9GAMM|nr:hypothetical protein [Woeseia oceani]ANO50052.1 hypothetical protein BA177_01385 [Woeseia oceani]
MSRLHQWYKRVKDARRFRPIPADLDEEDLARLRALADRVSAPELKARCYDVLWLRKREYALAERALRLASLFRRKESALFGHAASLLQT